VVGRGIRREELIGLLTKKSMRGLRKKQQKRKARLQKL